MNLFRKGFYVLTFFFVAVSTKVKAQKDYLLLYSNKKLNHNLQDTCEAKFDKEKDALVLYSGKDLDTFYFQKKKQAKLYKFNIGRLLTTGYYLLIGEKRIYLKGGIEGLKEYENKYEIQHYSHYAHASHASHYSQY